MTAPSSLHELHRALANSQRNAKELEHERDSLQRRNDEQVKTYNILDEANKRHYINLFKLEAEIERLKNGVVVQSGINLQDCKRADKLEAEVERLQPLWSFFEDFFSLEAEVVDDFAGCAHRLRDDRDVFKAEVERLQKGHDADGSYIGELHSNIEKLQRRIDGYEEAL